MVCFGSRDLEQYICMYMYVLVHVRACTCTCTCMYICIYSSMNYSVRDDSKVRELRLREDLFVA